MFKYKNSTLPCAATDDCFRVGGEMEKNGSSSSEAMKMLAIIVPASFR